MKEIKIGLFGALINNDNMGCCALTYGIINLLEKISKRNGVEFKYFIFERDPNIDSIEVITKQLNLKDGQIVSCKSAQFIRFYKITENLKCIKKIKQCDLVIDITQGDSFSDIYGMRRFLSYTLDKFMVEKCSKPLILGPQTYGPFNKKISKIFAKNVIKNAYAVFSRDNFSTEYLKNDIKIGNEIISVTDLAFCLPYKEKTIANSKKKVGINVSGLLWPNKYEETIKKFELKCDYREVLLKTIDYLNERDYEIFLISHVGADYNACLELKKERDNVNVVQCFSNPIEAKTYIASMDLFIGARMHATIGALSAKVPVIPTAYSRKFKGLFNSLDYNICVDLLNLSTDEAINMIEKYIDDLKNIENNIIRANENITSKYEFMINEFEKTIINIIKE